MVKVDPQPGLIPATPGIQLIAFQEFLLLNALAAMRIPA
jgi:hypothetical protein